MRNHGVSAASVFAWVVLVAIFISPQFAEAQQSPSIVGFTMFDGNVTFRNNVCDRMQQIQTGSVEMANALEGLQITVVLRDDPGFTNFKDGVLDPVDPGLIPSLLDEIAKRGGFTWRDSYAVVSGPTDGGTWGDLLIWSYNSFDVVGDWYSHTTGRMQAGASFPEGFLDASNILVATADEPDESFDPFTWQTPFKSTVWVLILCSIGFSAIVYYILELGQADGDLAEDSHVDNTTSSLFLAAASFTGGGGYAPRTPAGKLFAFSWSFWCLLTVSAYTANLASFLVVANQPEFSIESIQDAMAVDAKICVWGGTSGENFFKDNFPSANLHLTTTELGTYQGLATGDCSVTFASVDNWYKFAATKAANANCSLEWVGKLVQYQQNGLVTVSDSGLKCTSLVRDVLDLHMKNMKSDGFVDRAKALWVESGTDLSCDQEAASVETGQLGVKEMGGTFIIHAFLSAVALVMWAISTLLARRRNASGAGTGKTTPEDASSSSAAIEEATMIKEEPKTVDALHASPGAQNKEMMEEIAVLRAQQDQILRVLRSVQEDLQSSKSNRAAKGARDSSPSTAAQKPPKRKSDASTSHSELGFLQFNVFGFGGEAGQH